MEGKIIETILIFVPQEFCPQIPGYMYGEVVHDPAIKSAKFFVVGLRDVDSSNATNPSKDLIGYFSGSNSTHGFLDKRSSNWVNLGSCVNDQAKDSSCPYYIHGITLDNQRITFSTYHIVVIIYDRKALLQTELLVNKTAAGDHFQELKQILHHKSAEAATGKKSKLSFLVMFPILFLLHVARMLCKITSKLLPVLRYSTLGLHLNGWLENSKWTLATIVEKKGITLKTANYLLATTLDIAIGVLILRFLSRYVDEVPPSQILPDKRVVESLKSLVNWLMGAPAGLKLNHSFNGMLGRFFLYHINLWWRFLLVSKPVLDFAFNVLLLLGRLGITFQIAIAADLLAIVSFHSYCIYVYAARLFNMQLRGLTALFHLFFGKKKNPLRQRVDSCQYKADQLFVGTLLFTILMFLMPTTWVYYTVFTMLRLILIGLGGFLTRLRFYVQIMPVYAFTKWLLRSPVMSSSINMEMYPRKCEGPTTLIVSTVVSPWNETWERCLPDTVNPHPPVEWAKIVNNVFWGQLLYPL